MTMSPFVLGFFLHFSPRSPMPDNARFPAVYFPSKVSSQVPDSQKASSNKQLDSIKKVPQHIHIIK